MTRLLGADDESHSQGSHHEVEKEHGALWKKESVQAHVMKILARSLEGEMDAGQEKKGQSGKSQRDKLNIAKAKLIVSPKTGKGSHCQRQAAQPIGGMVSLRALKRLASVDDQRADDCHLGQSISYSQQQCANDQKYR